MSARRAISTEMRKWSSSSFSTLCEKHLPRSLHLSLSWKFKNSAQSLLHAVYISLALLQFAKESRIQFKTHRKLSRRQSTTLRRRLSSGHVHVLHKWIKWNYSIFRFINSFSAIQLARFQEHSFNASIKIGFNTTCKWTLWLQPVSYHKYLVVDDVAYRFSPHKLARLCCCCCCWHDVTCQSQREFSSRRQRRESPLATITQHQLADENLWISWLPSLWAHTQGGEREEKFIVKN